MTEHLGSQQDSGKCIQLWIKEGNPIQVLLPLYFLGESWQCTKIEKGHQTWFRATSALKYSALKVSLSRELRATRTPMAAFSESLT